MDVPMWRHANITEPHQVADQRRRCFNSTWMVPRPLTGTFYINMGYGTEPLNYSHAMTPVFQIVGPSNQQYPGSFCLPQVPLPANYTPKVGDNATIQVIEVAQHGASLYNCADITFAEPHDVPEVNETNCVNTTQAGQNIGFQIVYTTTSSPAPHTMLVNGYASILVPLMVIAASWTTWM